MSDQAAKAVDYPQVIVVADTRDAIIGDGEHVYVRVRLHPVTYGVALRLTMGASGGWYVDAWTHDGWRLVMGTDTRPIDKAAVEAATLLA